MIANKELANQTNFNNAFVSRSEEQSLDGGKTFQKYIAATPTEYATTASINAMTSTTSVNRMTGSTATTIHGVVAGQDGQILKIVNSSTADLTIKHQSGTASAANRIKLYNDADLTIKPNESFEIIYSSVDSRWYGIGKVSFVTGVVANVSITSTKTTTYTASTIDDVIPCDATSGGFTVNLPSASGNTGKRFIFKKIDTSSNRITIDPNSSETIDGYSTYVLGSYSDVLEIVSNGANWVILRNLVKTVAAYHLSANFNASTTVPINFDTSEYDSHAAVTVSATAWKFTAPYTDLYEINVHLYSGTSVEWVLYKGGTLTKQIMYTISSSNAMSGAVKLKLTAGEYIDIRPSSAVTVSGGVITGSNSGRIEIIALR